MCKSVVDQLFSSVLPWKWSGGRQKQKSSDFLKKKKKHIASWLPDVLLNRCTFQPSIFNQNEGEGVYFYFTISTYIYLQYTYIYLHIHIYLNLLCALVFICIYLLINTYKYTNNYKYSYKFKFSNIYKKRLVFNHCLTMMLIAIGTLKRFMENQLYIHGSN